jgi:hypothetical protein
MPYWTLPQRLVAPDPLLGKKGKLWNAKAGKDLSMLQLWCPPGLMLDQQVQLGDQALDVVGLPDTLSQGSEDFDLVHLSNAFVMMAKKRTTLGSIKSLKDLEHHL